MYNSKKGDSPLMEKKGDRHLYGKKEEPVPFFRGQSPFL